METARKRLQQGTAISAPTALLLQSLHQRVCDAFDRAVIAIEKQDSQAARKAVKTKASVNAAADEVMGHLAERLVAQEPDRLASFQVEADIVEHLKRLNNLTRRIARVVLRSPTREAEQRSAAANTP
jgi:phosphate:Na+ symporter